MSTAFRVSASATNTSAGSAFTTSITLPSSGVGGTVAVGDLVLILAVAERTQTPTISYGGTSTGVTTLRSTTTANESSVLAWKRINTSAELGATVAMNNVNGRRQTLGVVVISGAADPLISSTSEATDSGGNVIATAPAVTPTAADAMLVAFLSWLPYSGTLYGLTTTVASPWVERVDAMGAYTGGSNPGVAIATQQISGGAGANQTGAVWTTPQTNFFWIADTVTLLPSTTSSPPSMSFTDRGALYVFEAAGSPVGGGTLSYSIAQVSGATTPPVALGTGRWGVVQDSAPLVYAVTENESSNPLPNTQQFTIPALSVKGLSRRRKLTSAGWQ